MSTRNSLSTSRGLSDDIMSAKRHTEMERKLMEPSKRARRSSSRLAHEDSGNFIVVSSGTRRKKTTPDDRIEEEREFTSDDPRSTLERIQPDFKLPEDNAQRNADVGKTPTSSTKFAEEAQPLASGSDLKRDMDLGSPTPSEDPSSVENNIAGRASGLSPRESTDSIAPGSEWSSVHGSEHARGTKARTPGSENYADAISVSRHASPQAQTDVPHVSSGQIASTSRQRKPLPSYKEQSPVQNATGVSHPETIQVPKSHRSTPTSLSGRAHRSIERSARDESAQMPCTGAKCGPQLSTRVPDMSDSSCASASGCYGLRWEHDGHNSAPLSPGLDRLPNTVNSPLANSGSLVNSTTQSTIRKPEPGPFTTFPSSFSVLTTESVQQKNETKNGMKRGRKPNNHNIERPRTDPCLILSQREVENASGSIGEYVPSKPTPASTSDTKQATPPAQSGPPAISVFHGFYQTKLPPRPTTTPPPVPSLYPSEGYRPPALVLTVDSTVRDDLQTAGFQSFVEKFKSNAKAILEGINSTNNTHEIDPIMFHGLPYFYKWYSDNTGIADIGSLRFELIDVHWQKEQSFVVPEGSLGSFRTLKQYIWDIYWMAMDLNNALSMFRVSISQFPPREQGPFDASTTAWKAVNSSIPSKILSPQQPQGVMIVPTGVPKHFQNQAQNSPPNHHDSTLPTLSPLKTARQIPSLVHVNDPRVSSPGILLPSLPSPKYSPYLHGPYPRDLPPHIRYNEIDKRSSGQAQHQLQLQALYSTTDQRRTSREQSMMREYAQSLKLRDAELMPEESTVKDKLPYKTGAQVCSAVVDRMSGKGLVTVSGKGYITLNVTTAPDETGERFRHITIQPKQTCMLHGGAVVLYFKREHGHLHRPSSQPAIPRADANERPGGNGVARHSTYDYGMTYDPAKSQYQDELQLPPPSALLSKQQQPAQILYHEKNQLNSSTSNLSIKIRVQVDGTGRFSAPFDKSVLRPKITTIEFFEWFADQSRHSPPRPPHNLKFTFKDAMPIPQATEITAGNEDHFNYMRRDIKAQCEKAKRFMPELREFVILVTVPGWVSPGAEEEEDW